MWARDRLYSLNEAAFLFRHFSVKSSCIWCAPNRLLKSACTEGL